MVKTLRRIWNLSRMLIVAAVFARGLPAPHGIVLLGPQQHVVSINPKMGMHTRLTDEVEEWKIKRSLELVREMGARWIVEYFPWAYHEPQPGVYDWEHADLVISHAARQGLCIVARLGLVPQWARPEGSTPTYLAPQRYADFGNFVYAFVQRYQEQVGYLIIWNEPNLGLEWGFRPPDPAEYARMLAETYERAKEADPDIQILAGALSPTLGAPDAQDDLSYLQGMYDQGAAPYFDILAVHAYGWRFAPADPPAADAINFRRTELLREIMVRNGDAHKPVIITEGGWNDHPRWTKAVRPGQRIAYTIQAYEWVLHQWDWCQAAAWWAFRYPRPQPGYPDYFTFVTVDLIPRPVYLAVQQYAQGKNSAEWLAE